LLILCYLIYCKVDIDKGIVQIFNDMNKHKRRDPSDAIPNSWGRIDHNNTNIRPVYNEQLDINNHKKKLAFIRKFVVKNIDGASLERKRM